MFPVAAANFEAIRSNAPLAGVVSSSVGSGRVAPGGCPPEAPTDPYVLALEHTVPQIMHWHASRSSEAPAPAATDSAICRALTAMKLVLKKSRCTPANETGPT